MTTDFTHRTRTNDVHALTERVIFDGLVVCPRCHGEGAHPGWDGEPLECSLCHGELLRDGKSHIDRDEYLDYLDKVGDYR